VSEHSLPPLRLATRGSRQALGQSGAVAASITAATGRPVELVTIETTGDVRVDVPLHQIGGQGVFVKEVQRAVLDGRADLAVHSAKDLQSAQADGLVLAAFCERRDPRDALVGADLASLAEGCTVATGSVRRRAQLRRVRPDLNFSELRGNIDSRLSKIPDGGAIVMAVAALDILDMTDRIAETLAVRDFVPAVGQGCVAVECRDDDVATLERPEGDRPCRDTARRRGGASVPRRTRQWLFDAGRCTRRIGHALDIPGRPRHRCHGVRRDRTAGRSGRRRDRPKRGPRRPPGVDMIGVVR
jgi:hypothetical protein